MITTHEKTSGELYSARSSLRPINFYCDAPGAHSVQIAGDFNNWFPVPMHRRVDGWCVQVLLCHRPPSVSISRGRHTHARPAGHGCCPGWA